MNIRGRLALSGLAFAFAGALTAGLVACGGSDDSGTGDRAGTDEEYVAAICSAAAKFDESAMAIVGNLVDEDAEPKKAAAALAKPVSTLVSDFKKAKPPEDLKAYHEELVRAATSVEKLLKQGDLDAALAGDPFPEGSGAVEARLKRIAASNDDCVESGFLR